MPEDKKTIDMIEVRGKIERIEHHIKLLKDAQFSSEDMLRQTNTKLDQLIHILTDNPLNADRGLVKRFNQLEETVSNHVVYWKIFAGSLGGGVVLIGFIKFIAKFL